MNGRRPWGLPLPIWGFLLIVVLIFLVNSAGPWWIGIAVAVAILGVRYWRRA